MLRAAVLDDHVDRQNLVLVRVNLLAEGGSALFIRLVLHRRELHRADRLVPGVRLHGQRLEGRRILCRRRGYTQDHGHTRKALQRNAIYFLYWTVQVLAFPFLLLYLALRIARNAEYARRVQERFGFLPGPFRRTVPGAIWLHAVSVGEALTAVGLLRRIRERMPGTPVFVSCTTLAGRAMAETKLRGLADGVFYAPVDYRFAVRRVLRTLRPALVVVMETEIWPNLYRDAKLSGAALVVVNGRIVRQGAAQVPAIPMVLPRRALLARSHPGPG